VGTTVGAHLHSPEEGRVIVTIDGPAGSGKSTAAKRLAQRLGFEFLDTGATFRAVAYAALRAGVSITDGPGLQAMLNNLHLEMPPGGKVFLDSQEISLEIRTPSVTTASSELAVIPLVRQWLMAFQRQIAAGRNMVCEGRDQGTVVFPQADCKFFLTADPEERVRRRQRQLEARGDKVDRDALRQDVAARDTRDANRDLAPMKPAEDALLLDSSGLTVDQVVDCMEQEVCRRRRIG
jgi:cytidylate kinase